MLEIYDAFLCCGVLGMVLCLFMLLFVGSPGQRMFLVFNSFLVYVYL